METRREDSLPFLSRGCPIHLCSLFRASVPQVVVICTPRTFLPRPCACHLVVHFLAPYSEIEMLEWLSDRLCCLAVVISVLSISLCIQNHKSDSGISRILDTLSVYLQSAQFPPPLELITAAKATPFLTYTILIVSQHTLVPLQCIVSWAARAILCIWKSENLLLCLKPSNSCFSFISG